MFEMSAQSLSIRSNAACVYSPRANRASCSSIPIPSVIR